MVSPDDLVELTPEEQSKIVNAERRIDTYLLNHYLPGNDVLVPFDFNGWRSRALNDLLDRYTQPPAGKGGWAIDQITAGPQQGLRFRPAGQVVVGTVLPDPVTPAYPAVTDPPAPVSVTWVPMDPKATVTIPGTQTEPPVKTLAERIEQAGSPERVIPSRGVPATAELQNKPRGAAGPSDKLGGETKPPPFSDTQVDK